MSATLRAALMACTVLALAAPALADPIGTWLTESGNSRVKIENCGGALCGNVVWLKEPNEAGKPKLDKNNADATKRSRPMIGVPIVLSMKPNGPGKWSGEVYNAGDGKTYSGSITERDANEIRLEGCVLGGIICKAQTWTRVK